MLKYRITEELMGSPYQSDSMHHVHDVCKGICHRKILNVLYYCKYGILFSGDNETGPADEFKRTKRVHGWSCQIMGEGFYYLQYSDFVK